MALVQLTVPPAWAACGIAAAVNDACRVGLRGEILSTIGEHKEERVFHVANVQAAAHTDLPLLVTKPPSKT